MVKTVALILIEVYPQNHPKHKI